MRTAEEADAAAAAGAEACVSPVLVPEMIERCRTLGVPAIPGALTPTEIERARSLGVELVKLFPGSLGGPKYVREVLAPLADVELLVSGGGNPSNASQFIEAGASAVGVGSALTGAADVQSAARELTAAVRGLSEGQPAPLR